MNRMILVMLALSGALSPAWGQAALPTAVSSPAKAVPPSLAKGFSWRPVEKVLGKGGIEEGDHFQITFPRTDLNVLVKGFPLDSAEILLSRFTFQAPGPEAPKGTPVQMTAKLFLMDSEVPQAMALALQNGLEITAVYDPFLEESPSIKCLRLKGTGSRSNLAWAAKMVLSSTGTPVLSGAENAVANSTKGGSWEEVEDLFGQGEARGPTLSYQGMGLGIQSPEDGESWLFFQKDGKTLTVLGEFCLPEGKKSRLEEALLQKHIGVTALFTESCGGDHRDFVDFWAMGAGDKPAQDLKEALEQAFGSEAQIHHQEDEAHKEP